MLYYLSLLKTHYFGLNVFSYITFRSGMASMTAFLIAVLIGPMIIKKLGKIGMLTKPKVWGPQSQEQKTGTPVGGGLIIITSVLASSMLWTQPTNRFIILAQVIILAFGALGFYDDHAKIKKKAKPGKAEGVSSRIKFSLQLAFAALLACYLAVFPPNPEFATHLNIPYLKETYINFGAFYFFIAMLLFVGFANSVNLADGMDGLAIGNLIIACGALLVFVYVAGHAKFSDYLKIIPVAGSGELVVFTAAIIGAGLGFLWFNSYPAQVFMGDTGSLPMGTLLAYISIISKQELILLLIGGVFVAETISVVTQMSFFKVTKGRRIFKMAPFHHHFELSGTTEPKVTVRFWIVGIILGLIALASLKLR
ncbi:phospho-N-acetylmuramoyl-pentapeptide-transferase [Elusimicrobiota bacterium]